MIDFVQGEEETDSDTVVFHLDYLCKEAPDADLDHAYTERVLSSHLTWVPQGSQEEKFPGWFDCYSVSFQAVFRLNI